MSLISAVSISLDSTFKVSYVVPLLKNKLRMKINQYQHNQALGTVKNLDLIKNSCLMLL